MSRQTRWDFGEVSGAVRRDMADKVSAHYKGCIHVFFSKHVHGCEFPGVVTRMPACEVKPEGVAVHVGCDLVKACHIAVATESSKGELGSNCSVPLQGSWQFRRSCAFRWMTKARDLLRWLRSCSSSSYRASLPSQR